MKLLAGDLGGTKTLLGLYETDDAGLRLIHESRFESAAFSGLPAMIDAFLSQVPGTPAASIAATSASTGFAADRRKNSSLSILRRFAVGSGRRRRLCHRQYAGRRDLPAGHTRGSSAVELRQSAHGFAPLAGKPPECPTAAGFENHSALYLATRSISASQTGVSARGGPLGIHHSVADHSRH